MGMCRDLGRELGKDIGRELNIFWIEIDYLEDKKLDKNYWSDWTYVHRAKDFAKLVLFGAFVRSVMGSKRCHPLDSMLVKKQEVSPSTIARDADDILMIYCRYLLRSQQ